MDISSDTIIDDLRGTFRGRLRFDAITRGLYATDASPFQITPLGVAVPADEADAATLVRYCHEHLIPIVPRGAGTGVAGEALGPGLILDLSQSFRRIVHIGEDSATVQPGVVHAELNAALAGVGRRFAPDPASSATCTLGGMVATNASGANAFRFGYTRDHLLGLRVVWDAGDVAELAPGQPLPSTPSPKRGGGERGLPLDSAARFVEGMGDWFPLNRTQEIAAAVTALLTSHGPLLTRARPQALFNRCGYSLHGVLTAAGLDLPKVLCGSEGTLALVTEATLRTVPLPGGSCMALLGFASLDAAARAGLDLRTFEPVSCDLLDQRLLSLTRAGRSGAAAALVPPTVGAALVVAWEADTEREASERAWGAIERLREKYRLAVLADPTCDPGGARRIQAVRSSAVAGLYALGAGPRPISCIEDVGVPPDALPEYLTTVQGLLRQFDLTGSLLVHVLAGQVHARPLVDMNREEDRAKLWPVAEAVHSAALALGGTVSTQHGTGLARTPWVEKQYGPLMPVFRELKRIFDPKGLLNPGKIIGPDPSRPAWPLREISAGKAESPSELRIPHSTFRNSLPLLIWTNDSPIVAAAACNGCGDCRPRVRGERTCPVFQAVGMEAATPRAKANLIRLLNGPRADPAGLASHDARAVADLCVNCKMCRDTCHARINIPKLMHEVKAAHQAEHGLDRMNWAFARVESLAAIGSNFAPFINELLAQPVVRWALEKALGLSRRRRLPAFAPRSFLKRARGAATRKRGMRNAECGIKNESQDHPAPVALFVDTFANYCDPSIAEAAVAVLKHNGVPVYVPPKQTGCGMAPLLQGDVESARDMAARNVRMLADLVREGYRVVTPEPTAAVMLTQDNLDLLDDPDALLVAENVEELSSYLWRLYTAGRLRTDFQLVLDITLGHHVPCHVKALHGPVAGPWLLSLIPGVRNYTIDVSCSGMAGVYGLRAANREASLAAGRPMLEELNRPRILFGSTECGACRIQMQEGTGKRTLHPVQYLAHAYGLMPEIGARLRRPLGELVTD